jgi:hypothetical protein
MHVTLGDLAQAVIAITVSINCWQSWKNGRKAEKIVNAVELVKQQTDGITKELVKVTAKAEFAKGLKQGEESTKNGT